DGDGSTVTSGVNAAQSRIKLDHIRTTRHVEIRDRLVLIKIKYGHWIVFFARQKSTMMFRIERHSVVAFATSDRIAPDHLVRCGVDHGKDILILQIHIYLASHWIILRHSGLS